MTNRDSASRYVGNYYKALRRINRAITLAQNREQLFERLCRAAVEPGGYSLVWVAPSTGAAPPIIPHVVHAITNGGKPLIEIAPSEIPMHCRIGESAARHGRRALWTEDDASSATEAWRAAARSRGIRACAAFILRTRDDDVGEFCVCTGASDLFQPDELDLLQDVADDICLGIDRLARDEERKREDTVAQRFAAIVESTNDAIISKTVDGTITSWNPAAERMFGYPAQDIIGRNIVALIPSDRLTEERDILARIARGERIVDFETVRMRKNGAPIPVSITVSPLKSADGTVIGASKIVRDITDRKIAAEALHCANVNLERRVNERTAELEIAKERAESADLLKSAFLATMSHELRTPLNSIIGFTGLILHGMAGPLNDEQTRQLGMVQGSARHLLSVINDVLDISKIEAGQLEIHAAAFDVREAADKVLGLIEPMAARKGLALSVDAPAESCMVVGDRRRVEQVLLNLLNNAVKFTERGEVTLKIEPMSQPRQIRFSVTDTGIGIKAGDIATLFKPFRQIDSGLTRQHEGTGLGLSICSRLADLLRGQIHVESTCGRGSKFIFSIPVE